MNILVSFIYLFIVEASAKSLSLGSLSTGETDIDVLIKDAVITYRSMLKSLEPMLFGSFGFDLSVQSLQCKLVNTRIWFGHTSSYEETSSIRKDKIITTLNITQANVQIEGIILITSNEGTQNGTFKLKLDHYSQTIFAELEFDAISVRVSQIDLETHCDAPLVHISGIAVNGISNEQLQKEVIIGLLKQMKLADEQLRQIVFAEIFVFNQYLEGYTVEELYDHLRNYVPYSNQQHL